MDKNKSVADFMNSFLNTPEPKIDNEYYEIEEQYFRQFGHGVPREMLPDSISTEQIKQAMKKCILSKKDNLFELLGIIIYIKKRNDDMDEDNIITLNDENGNEVEFEFLDLIPYRQNEYVVLLPIGDSDGQVVILQLKEIDDETEEYVGVENEFVLETVFALFKERNKDFFTFE